MPEPTIRLQDCWAKTDPATGKPAMTVFAHGLNAWAVGSEADELAVMAGIPAFTLAWVLALHDIGKISIGFLSQSEPWLRGMGVMEMAKLEGWLDGNTNCRDHGRLTGKTLLDFGLAQGPKADKLVDLVAAHHGRLYGGRWVLQMARETHHPGLIQQLRMQMVKALDRACSLGMPLAAERIPQADGALIALAGWVTVCDWLASDERHFPLGADTVVETETARARARGALASVGWFRPTARERTFAQACGDLSPRPLQEALHRLAVRPGIFIVEAQMGEGKSKAALWAGHGLIRSRQARGLYFAMPTQVTSERVWEEAMRPFVENSFEWSEGTPESVRLIHSASWLRMMDDPDWNQNRPDDGGRDARDWFHGNKRALLAPFGVGTIDQALLGVLAKKHFFVRIAALSGKVVVLDEIHSYDLYTGTLIARLVQWLAQCGATVIVLSATLTEAARNRLLSAAGVAPPPPHPDESGGLQNTITWAPWPETGKGTVQACLSRCATGIPHRCVRVEHTEMDCDAIAIDLARRAQRGERVLWIRNSVANAIEAWGRCATAGKEEGPVPTTGLLHSRFTWGDRQRNEAQWIELYQQHEREAGSVLIATQVAEQSLNLDADFLVTDLAPTDMMLQRIGRLWRFPGTRRPTGCAEPVVRILHPPHLDCAGHADEIRDALAPLCRVYDPYLVLRSLEVWQGTSRLNVPQDIRRLLEATYAARVGNEEPFPAWAELARRGREAAAEMEGCALGASDIWGRPTTGIEEDNPWNEPATRLIRFPSLPLVLLRSPVGPDPREKWHFWNGDEVVVPDSATKFRDTLPFRRAMFESAVKVPAWLLRRTSDWFPERCRIVTRGNTAFAWVDGCVVRPCDEPSGTDPSRGIAGLTYTPCSGLLIPQVAAKARAGNTPDYEALAELEW